MNRLKIADFAEVITGGTPNTSKKEYWENGNIPWLQSGACQNCVITECNTFITEMGLKNSSAKMMQPDSVLIALTGATTGKVGYLTFKACANQSVTGIQPNERFLPKYLYFYLLGIRQKILADSYGGAQKHISQGYVKNIEVPLGTLAEQQIIVKNFEKINSIINNYKEKLKYLDLLIKARFVEMFGDIVLNPNGWDKYKFGDVCDVRDGTHDSPQYYREGYPLVTSKNVTGGIIDITDCSLICEEDYRKINQRSKVDYGDILMPMIGTVGSPIIVNVEPRFAIKNVALIKFKDNSKVLNTFVKALLESDYFDNAVINKIRGGTQKFISLGDIRKLEICLPPIEVQEGFESFTRQVDKSKFVKINLVIYDNII